LIFSKFGVTMAKSSQRIKPDIFKTQYQLPEFKKNIFS
jgi:hypothetical protein